MIGEKKYRPRKTLEFLQSHVICYKSYFYTFHFTKALIELKFYTLCIDKLGSLITLFAARTRYFRLLKDHMDVHCSQLRSYAFFTNNRRFYANSIVRIMHFLSLSRLPAMSSLQRIIILSTSWYRINLKIRKIIQKVRDIVSHVHTRSTVSQNIRFLTLARRMWSTCYKSR